MKKLIKITIFVIMSFVLLCSCSDNNTSVIINSSDITASENPEYESIVDNSIDISSEEANEANEEMLNRAYKISKGDTPEKVHEIMGREPDSLFGSGIYGEVYYINEDKKEDISLQYLRGVVSVVYHNNVTGEHFSILNSQ